MNDRAPITLGVCAIFKDETPYLREWIEFHRLVGVERFFLYDNNDHNDDWWQVLRPYIADGLVQIVHWPGERMQLPAYGHAISTWGRMVRWLAFLDVDEFLFNPDGYSVPQLLASMNGVAALGVCWAVYGTGHVKRKSDGLVTLSYQHRTTDPHLNRHVKSIVRTARAFNEDPHDPHHFRVDGDSIDELGRPLQGPFAVAPTHSLLRVNHYVSKSEAEAQVKMSRRRADNGALRQTDLLDPSLNALHDPSIVWWAEKLKRRLAA